MLRSFIALTTAAMLVGCSSGEEGEVKLGVSVAAVTATTTNTTTPSGSTTTNTSTAKGSALEITGVRLLVAHAKIGYIGEQSTGDSAEAGPYVVSLSKDEIAKGAQREFSLGKLASGTYGGAEIEIEPLDADQDASTDELAEFQKTGASVLVDGTYDGKAFTFAGHFLAEQGTDGEVTVDAAKPVALAMTVDPSSWFRDANGAFIDPTDSAQHDTIAVAICKTLDTQPQVQTTNGDPTAQPAHMGGGKGGGGKGGGQAHCVEGAQ